MPRAAFAAVLIAVFLFSSSMSVSPTDDTGGRLLSETGPLPEWDALINIPELEEHVYAPGDGTTASNPGLVYILVEPGLYPHVSSRVDRYMADMALDGFTAELYTGGWADETEAKTLLQTGYSAGMVGAVFVGDIPLAWAEHEDWFSGTYYGWTEYPIDLYFMDLDGEWVDSDGNGFYDDHLAGTGDLEPEIWIGRLYASTVTISGETEISLIQNYFDKNHEYRMGNLSLPDRALVYVDDDWESEADEWSNDVGIRYDNHTLVKDIETTRADDYLPRLDDGYDWISLFAHSGDWYHGLMYNGGATWSWVDNIEVSAADPSAHFYNLYCCHAGNFSYSDYDGYLAGHYVFSQSHSMAAVASAKTGSMLNFDDFYNPLADGATIGEAFLEWFILNGETGAGIDSRCWFYGMTIIGDPTLDTFDDVLPEAPIGRTVDVSGGDLKFGWGPSPSPDIQYYNIYRGESLADMDFSTPNATTLGRPDPLNCTWTDVDEANNTGWNYYGVRAVDRAGNVDDNILITGTYIVDSTLYDWRLVSTPFGTDDLGSIADSVDAEIISTYDPQTCTWESYNIHSQVQSLSALDCDRGFWLRSTADRFFLTGTVETQRNIQLRAGWNLVGYPSSTPDTVANVFWGTGATKVAAFDGSAHYNIREVGPDHVMMPGHGYWVYLPADAIWTVDW